MIYSYLNNFKNYELMGTIKRLPRKRKKHLRKCAIALTGNPECRNPMRKEVWVNISVKFKLDFWYGKLEISRAANTVKTKTK